MSNPIIISQLSSFPQIRGIDSIIPKIKKHQIVKPTHFPEPPSISAKRKIWKGVNRQFSHSYMGTMYRNTT